MFYSEEFEKKLQEFLQELGTDLYGVADLTPAKEFVLSQGGKCLQPFSRAIAIGFKLSDTIINSLSHLSDQNAFLTYNHYIHHTVDKLLDRTGALAARFIESSGYLAYPVPAFQTTAGFKALFSHKIAPYLAGLGWIGKNCLLITPEYGPRVRLATILTDAPLKTGHPKEEQCGNCNLCIKSCPARAIQGNIFDPAQDWEMRIDANACARYSGKRAKAWGFALPGSACGLCVAICPYGRKIPGARLIRLKRDVSL